MTENEISVVWSEVEGNRVLYRLYRVATTPDLIREEVELSDDLLVYQGTATEYGDTSVTAGTRYTYFLVAEVDGNTLPRRWTEALAVTDTEPPQPVRDLTAEVTDAGVLLRWSPSSDNVAFGEYAVSIVEGNELIYIGGTSDPNLTTFLDDGPPSGPITYAVQAVDFHGNRTDPAVIEVTVP